ncbi:beta-lactamase/transpeptidase-like protein [Artomyces pyxidatus]|uniref:Beta-lactamase/transpeptidase-like protein n=1 Tax=Artomyces pyxidatus TaxID=48021 RepID=A0ACB8T377_9AGAM|nr:beta-lactamase/transpeptidase-like protein [Artomyces pyxidatus]
MTRFLHGLLAVLAIPGTLAISTTDQQPLLRLKDDRILTPSLVEFIDGVVKTQQVEGLTLAVIRADGESEYGAWGRKTEDDDEMTTDTLFDIGSCSKAFVTAAIGILIDDYAHARNTTPLPTGLKKLDWDSKLKRILPDDWKHMDPWASEQANLVDILSHVSGLPRHEIFYGPGDDTKSVVRNQRYQRPAFELREQWSYNNQMYMIGAEIIRTFTGSFTEFVEERIFKPLNMTDTTYSPDVAHASGKATQTWTSFGRRIPWWLSEDWQVELAAGPGGVISSAVDLEKWVRMLLNKGVDPRTKKTIIPLSALSTIVSAHSIVNGNPPGVPGASISGYGLGWERTAFNGHDMIQHGGALPGSSAAVIGVLADGVGVVALANADSKGVANSIIATEVLQKLLGFDGESSLRIGSYGINTTPYEAPHAVETVDPPSYNYVGVYKNDVFGTLLLCNASSTSHYCGSILDDFSAVDGVSPPQNSSKLFAELPSLWTSHVRLLYKGDNVFHFQPTYLFPEGYGKNTTPFEEVIELSDRASAVFVVENGDVVGFGLTGTVIEGLTMREKEGGSVEYTADAWFAKL